MIDMEVKPFHNEKHLQDLIVMTNMVLKQALTEKPLVATIFTINMVQKLVVITKHQQGIVSIINTD